MAKMPVQCAIYLADSGVTQDAYYRHLVPGPVKWIAHCTVAFNPSTVAAGLDQVLIVQIRMNQQTSDAVVPKIAQVERIVCDST